MAAFNGGFRFQDAKGGFYLDGRTAVPLRDGAASVVVYKDGHVDIGTWGSEVTMTANVSAVLQNLVPLVDHGQLDPSATYSDNHIWGDTLGGTGGGPLRHRGHRHRGPGLRGRAGAHAPDLAESLQRAGAVRAMTLDINPEWVTFNFFPHPDPTNPSVVAPTKLYPQIAGPRLISGSHLESRDFFMISVPS